MSRVQPTRTPKVYDYEAFVEELRQLRHEAANSFAIEERVAESTTFKRWQLRLDDQLSKICALGWAVKCGHAGRTFAATNQFEDDDASFDVDLVDTLEELGLVIKNFEKYGTPPLTYQPKLFQAAAPEAPAPLLPPDKVTWHWIKLHMTVGGWVMVGSVVAGLMGAAFGLGHWSATYEHAASNTPGAMSSVATRPASRP